MRAFGDVLRAQLSCMRLHGALNDKSLFSLYLLVLLSLSNSSYCPGNGRPLGITISGAGGIPHEGTS